MTSSQVETHVSHDVKSDSDDVPTIFRIQIDLSHILINNMQSPTLDK